MNNLKSEALMICNLEVDMNGTFNYSYVSSELPSHKQWLSSVTHELNSFIKSQLPGRQRLSVAIGVAKMIKNCGNAEEIRKNFNISQDPPQEEDAAVNV